MIKKLMLDSKKSFRLLNWKLLLIIFATLMIPILYRTLRIFFIGTIPGTYNYSIAANLQWINVLFEVLEEAFLLPLFFTLNKIIKNENIVDTNRKITWQLIMITSIYLIAIIIFIISARGITNIMSVQHITDTTIKFIRIEFATRFFVMIGKVALILLIAKNKWKAMLALLFLSTIINVFLDLFIVSNNPLSLQKGIMWIGYDQLIATSVMSILYFGCIYRMYSFKPNHLIPIIFFNKMDWRQFTYSGLESLVRNAFFILFVIKTINKMNDGQNQGDFWVMNTFMWDWLLLPILAISQYLNRDQAFSDKTHSLKERLFAPFIIITVIISIWFIAIPAYEPFIRVVMNNKNSSLISHLAIISLVFYVVMALNDPIDKILFGDGKAHYVLIQSLATNVLVFIPYYFLKKTMTIDDVAIMMGIAMALDSALTFIMFIFWFRKRVGISKKEKTA